VKRTGDGIAKFHLQGLPLIDATCRQRAGTFGRAAHGVYDEAIVAGRPVGCGHLQLPAPSEPVVTQSTPPAQRAQTSKLSTSPAARKYTNRKCNKQIARQRNVGGPDSSRRGACAPRESVAGGPVPEQVLARAAGTEEHAEPRGFLSRGSESRLDEPIVLQTVTISAQGWSACHSRDAAVGPLRQS
jgi:hypothetical protein